MRRSYPAIVVTLLLLTSVHTGCRSLVQSIMNAVCPAGSSAEPGISDQQRRARAQQETLNNLNNAPLSSENR